MLVLGRAALAATCGSPDLVSTGTDWEHPMVILGGGGRQEPSSALLLGNRIEGEVACLLLRLLAGSAHTLWRQALFRRQRLRFLLMLGVYAMWGRCGGPWKQAEVASKVLFWLWYTHRNRTGEVPNSSVW